MGVGEGTDSGACCRHAHRGAVRCAETQPCNPRRRWKETFPTQLRGVGRGQEPQEPPGPHRNKHHGRDGGRRSWKETFPTQLRGLGRGQEPQEHPEPLRNKQQGRDGGRKSWKETFPTQLRGVGRGQEPQ
eukprot:gene14832-biopygen2371